MCLVGPSSLSPARYSAAWRWPSSWRGGRVGAHRHRHACQQGEFEGVKIWRACVRLRAPFPGVYGALGPRGDPGALLAVAPRTYWLKGRWDRWSSTPQSPIQPGDSLRQRTGYSIPRAEPAELYRWLTGILWRPAPGRRRPGPRTTRAGRCYAFDAHPRAKFALPGLVVSDGASAHRWTTSGGRDAPELESRLRRYLLAALPSRECRAARCRVAVVPASAGCLRHSPGGGAAIGNAGAGKRQVAQQ